MIEKNLRKMIFSLLIGSIIFMISTADKTSAFEKPEQSEIIEDVISLSELDLESEKKSPSASAPEINGTTADFNFQQLKNYYIVDSKTAMTSDYFDYSKFMSSDIKIKQSDDKPVILVFHTHSQEMFIDSGKNDINEGIVGAGTRLCDRLEKVYGLKCIHVTDSFDVVNGKNQILGAYERMEPVIKDILNKNPSVDMVIDMHRDGVPESTHLSENINGKPTAQIMFFNGLCRLNKNGTLNNIQNLENPYIPQNLALSFRMKLKADNMYPNLTRKIYLNAYRYSLHMMPKSMLIEVGAQTNTKQEIYNAVDYLADIIASTVK
jgi:stage II sporulation protein P